MDMDLEASDWFISVEKLYLAIPRRGRPEIYNSVQECVTARVIIRESASIVFEGQKGSHKNCADKSQ